MSSGSSPYQPTPDDIYPPSGEDPLYEFVRVIHRITPRVYVARLLFLANVLVFAAMVASGVSYYLPTPAEAVAWGASYAPDTTSGQWWRLLTCMFVHFGILHLGLNMWVLWQLGPLAERLMGNVGFLLMYLISGLVGSLASLYWSPQAVSAGASGAIFGVAGAVLSFTLLQKNSIPMATFSGIKSSMVAFVGYNMLFGFAINAAKPGGMAIGMAAHTGGLVAGLICGILLSQPIELAARRRRWSHNLLMLSVGFLAIGVGIRYMPHVEAAVTWPTNEATQAIDRLNAVQNSTDAAMRGLSDKLNARQIDGGTFAATVERDVIPPLQQTRAQFVALKQVPAEAQGQMGRVIRYLEVRERSLQLLADAVREDRESKLEEFKQQQALANKLWGELTKPAAR